MKNKYFAKLNHIAENKQIILSCIILSLAVIFLFSLQEKTQAKTDNQDSPNAEFVIKAQENLIQPTEVKVESVPVDSFISEKSYERTVTCAVIAPLTPIDSPVEVPAKISAPILMYHYIEVPSSTSLAWLYHTPAVFEAQLKTLANNCYQSVFVSDIAQAVNGVARLAPNTIAITFDDGYEDMYTEAYPLLRKYGMKGTMYIIVNALDKPGYLTKDQVKEMSDSGYVEIASHTMNHANLNKSNWPVAKYEMTASKAELEKIVGRPVDAFAYPYGFFTLRDEEICRQAGYLTCASTYPGQVQTFAKRYSLYRLRPAYRVGQALINWLEAAGPKK